MATYLDMRMPLGLYNAPAIFPHALDIILSVLRLQSCLLYFDDIIVFSRGFEQHIDYVNEILSLLRAAGATLNHKKCAFFQQ